MKLRNKKTGKILKLQIHNIGGKEYNSLAEINEEWEDYEESKDYWYLNCDGAVIRAVYKSDDLERSLIAIGNYFETPEEAEKTVEKLEAWKRLKDRGVEFYGWRRNHTGTYDLLIRWKDRVPRSYEVKKDLDLLFGGEE